MESDKQNSFSTKIAHSANQNEKAAVEELKQRIYQEEMHTVIFFCSPVYDLNKLAACLQASFPCTVIGCTTSGEITSNGYFEKSIVAAGISGNDLKIRSFLIDPVNQFDLTQAEKLFKTVQSQVQQDGISADWKQFGFLLVDGLSMQEENLIASLYHQFYNIPIFGGSAGDDLHFQSTSVYYDGRFISNAAVFSLFQTTLPFHVFKIQHFIPGKEKLVITESDPVNRKVMEINGEPAAEEYARILGLKIEELTPVVFSTYPVILKIGGDYYVRSIQKVNDDGSLTFFCAIDDGLVLTVGHGQDMVDNLNEMLTDIHQNIPSASFILGCDCILRRLEILEKNHTQGILEQLRKFNFIGFSTYGEQFNSIHVNQTLTGIAIGSKE